MGGFIGFIIIMVIVAKAIDTNGKKHAKMVKEQETRKTPMEESVQYYEEPAKTNQTRKRPAKPAFRKQETRKQEDRKPTYQDMGEIMKRASSNVSEEFNEDSLKVQADRHENCLEGHYEESTDLVKAVEDLIVLGPNCNISYERDFVAEGEKLVSFF